jgi:hypothetical protein
MHELLESQQKLTQLLPVMKSKVLTQHVTASHYCCRLIEHSSLWLVPKCFTLMLGTMTDQSRRRYHQRRVWCSPEVCTFVVAFMVCHISISVLSDSAYVEVKVDGAPYPKETARRLLSF